MSVLETESEPASSLVALDEPLPSLLAQYRAGDDYAFTILYGLSVDRVMAWLARSLRHPRYRADLHDALQESFLSLSQGSESFATDWQIIRWLVKTATNAAINFHRRRRPTADSQYIYQATKSAG